MIGRQQPASRGSGIVRAIQRRLARLPTALTGLNEGTTFVPMEDAVWRGYEAMEKLGHPPERPSGLSTGFGALDDLIGGLRPGQLILVGAAPGLGSSTLGLNLLRAASVAEDHASALVSLDHSQGETVMRLMSAEARIPFTRVRTGTLTDDDWTKLAQPMADISSAAMFIDDSPNVTVREICRRVRALKRQHDLRLLVIDRVDLIAPPFKVGSHIGSREQDAATFGALAKELDLAIVAICQLARSRRADTRPQLTDLRHEHRSLARQADVVILLHREDAYERESPRAGEADLIVIKNRNGPPRSVVVSAQFHYSRLVEIPNL
jgi:replicative DNA helicase